MKNSKYSSNGNSPLVFKHIILMHEMKIYETIKLDQKLNKKFVFKFFSVSALVILIAYSSKAALLVLIVSPSLSFNFFRQMTKVNSSCQLREEDTGRDHGTVGELEPRRYGEEYREPGCGDLTVPPARDAFHVRGIEHGA